MLSGTSSTKDPALPLIVYEVSFTVRIALLCGVSPSSANVHV